MKKIIAILSEILIAAVSAGNVCAQNAAWAKKDCAKAKSEKVEKKCDKAKACAKDLCKDCKDCKDCKTPCKKAAKACAKDAKACTKAVKADCKAAKADCKAAAKECKKACTKK